MSNIFLLKTFCITNPYKSSKDFKEFYLLYSGYSHNLLKIKINYLITSNAPYIIPFDIDINGEYYDN